MNPTPVKAVNFDPFAGGEVALTAPTTEAQREIWASVQMGTDANLAYNESASLPLTGIVDVPALQGAINALVARHEALRTTFSADGQSLCIAPSQTLKLAVIPWLELDPTARAAAVAQHLKTAVETPFNLERGPLLRAELLQLTPTESLLVLTSHHIVCDGWSWGVMLPELGQFYAGLKRGQLPQLEPPERFSDYAVMLTAKADCEETRATERYWLAQFADTVPILNLPTDYPRPALRTFKSRREDRQLDLDVIRTLKQIGSKQGCSLLTILLAAYEVFLYRLTGQDDLVVGIPAAGQAASDRYQLVGHCVNLLPLRSHPQPGQTFSQYLASRRPAVLDAYDHQQFTFGRLVQQLSLPRDPSRIPLVSTIFNIDAALEGEALPFEGLAVAYRTNPRSYENFELAVNATELKDQFILEWEYNTSLFSPETAARQMQAFQTLLAGVAANPEQTLATLPFLPEGDRLQLAQWQNTTRPFPQTLIQNLIEAQVERNPHALAVQFEGTSLTYGELNRRANQLAHYLRAQGVGPDTLVGLCCPRCLDMAVAFLGILKAGGAYVPLDPDYPGDRLAFMIADSQMPVLLTTQALQSHLPPFAGLMMTIDGDHELISHCADDNPTPLATLDNLAYVIYTSGSTGTPKGVLIHQRGLVNHATAMAEAFALTAQDRVLQFASMSFDIAVEELFPTWISGAALILRTEACLASIPAFLSFLAAQQVTIADLPTAFWHEWMKELAHLPHPLPPNLRLVIVGGEKAALNAYQAWQRVIGSRCRWLNTYGPTETTVTATLYEPGIDPHLDLNLDLAIGKAIANYQTYVLDPRQQPVLVGAAGELYLGGPGVARGYLNRDDLTRERFIPNPFSDNPQDRLYKTGDLVRYRPDGNLEFLGRTDHQVKIRGFRIELGEIEGAIATYPDVQQAVVILREEEPGDKRLVGYFVTHQPAAEVIPALRQQLKQKLPEYMIPSALMPLATLPISPNGKVNLKALPAPDYGYRNPLRTVVAPRTAIEQGIAQIWREVLKLDPISIHDNFFELGGHSLLAIQVVSRMSRTFDLELSLRNLFEMSTVAALTAHIENVRWLSQSPPLATDGEDYEAGEF